MKITDTHGVCVACGLPAFISGEDDDGSHCPCVFDEHSLGIEWAYTNLLFNP
jgi:hypothetical protein